LRRSDVAAELLVLLFGVRREDGRKTEGDWRGGDDGMDEPDDDAEDVPMPDDDEKDGESEADEEDNEDVLQPASTTLTR
jgi:hypothetical protein